MITNKTTRVFRGIAILMVIASHYAAAMYVEPVYPAVRDFVSKLGIYGVDIFFLLSGYGLVKSYLKHGINKEFVIKRVMNTYVPYVLVVGFFTIMDKGISGPMDIVYLLIGYDYWFMAVLFSMYIFFMVIYRIGKFKEILISIAVVGFTYVLYRLGKADFWEVSNGAFLIGIYVASLENKYGDKVEILIKKINLTAIFLGATILGCYLYASCGAMWAHMVASMCFTMLVLGLCVETCGGGVILPAIGRYSLYIYMLHLRLFWMFVNYRDEWGYAKGAVIAAIITLIISISLGYAIEWNLNRITNRLINNDGEKS